VDPRDEKPQMWSGGTLRVRVSMSSGVLPVPSEAYETVDYKMPGRYLENKEKDTLPKDAEGITYKLKLANFEMKIMEW